MPKTAVEKSETKKKDNLELSLFSHNIDSNFANFYSPFVYPYYASFNFFSDCYGPYCSYYTPFVSPIYNSFDLYSFDFCDRNEPSSCIKVTEIKDITDEEKKEEKKIEDESSKLSFGTKLSEEFSFNKEEFDKQVEDIKNEYEKYFLKLNPHIFA
ncbi:hypothetical protein BpHYR1_046914 [Brachionus plicatilis]|uniref:Uncharacterized protein n=1 Tax=Brachionus plicatilis TaxID=10195 RepID=A0A3M7RIR9_BRAPC|nr:hypothetical protein BpHYR1_046914 [Brachionus plicatilis]